MRCIVLRKGGNIVMTKRTGKVQLRIMSNSIFTNCIYNHNGEVKAIPDDYERSMILQQIVAILLLCRLLLQTEIHLTSIVMTQQMMTVAMMTVQIFTK